MGSEQVSTGAASLKASQAHTGAVVWRIVSENSLTEAGQEGPTWLPKWKPAGPERKGVERRNCHYLLRFH